MAIAELIGGLLLIVTVDFAVQRLQLMPAQIFRYFAVGQLIEPHGDGFAGGQYHDIGGEGAMPGKAQ
ncbi:hypothetical protein D3C71_1334170 [compost metagenome]